MSRGPVINVTITGDEKGLKAATDKAAANADKAGAKFRDFGKKVGLAFAGAAIAAAAFAVKSGAQLEEAQAHLRNAIDNTNGSWADSQKTIAAVSKTMEKYGFTNADVQTQLARLTLTTGSVGKASSEMGLAADLAAGRHISLAAATDILNKVNTGHVALLGRMGIATKDLMGHTISQQQAIESLSKKYSGSASDSSKTFAGQIKVLHAQFTDIAAKIGQKVIPILEKLGAWLVKHKPVLIAFAAVIGTVLVAAFVAWAIAAAHAAVVTLTAAAPVIAVAAACAALVAAVVLVWTHWDEIWNWIMNHKAYAIILAILLPIPAFFILIIGALKELYTNWDSIWASIQEVVKVVWDAIKPIVQGALGVISGIFNFWKAIFSGDFSGAWNALGQIVSGAWEAIKGYISLALSVIGFVWGAAWGALSGVVSTAWEGIKTFISGIPGDVTSLLSGIGSVLSAPFTSAFGLIKSAWNSTVGGFKIPSIDVLGFHTPGFSIPKMHTGGVFNSGMGEGLALLKDGEGIFTPQQMAALSLRGSGGGTTVNNFPAGAAPAAVAAALDRHNRRNGVTPPRDLTAAALPATAWG